MTVAPRDLIGRFAARRRTEAAITLAPLPTSAALRWPEDFAVLAFDDDPDLRMVAARSDLTEARILIRLISDPDPRVRAAASENPDTPLIDAARALRDDDPFVRDTAARRLRGERLEPGMLDTARESLRAFGGDDL